MMQIDLAAAFPVLLPRAIAWAEARAQGALESGMPLSDARLALACSVGVRNPERIRIATVPVLPLPEDPELRQAAIQTGLLAPGIAGLTLGYAVFLCKGHEENPKLLKHEFRHVYQYETGGSIRDFLPVYLSQIVQFGYANAPLELDARAHERATV